MYILLHLDKMVKVLNEKKIVPKIGQKHHFLETMTFLEKYFLGQFMKNS